MNGCLGFNYVISVLKVTDSFTDFLVLLNIRAFSSYFSHTFYTPGTLTIGRSQYSINVLATFNPTKLEHKIHYYVPYNVGTEEKLKTWSVIQ